VLLSALWRVTLATKARRQNFQTISWFWDLRKRDLLDLDPPYQRRSVWNQSYKDAFIDTIILQYPAPAIFLYEEVSPEGTSKYSVVDGKQRLTAAFEFANGQFPIAEESPVSHLRGKYFQQLSDDDRTSFWTYQFSVEYLPTNEETIVNGIFERINRNTAKLTRQELRHARFSGPFISLAEEMAERMTKALPDGFPRIESQSRKQMKDVELVANLLLYFEDGVRGYSQDELDQAFSDRETNWDNTDAARQRFTETLDCLKELVKKPEVDPLFKTRLRNQADFYSLFTACAELLQRGSLKCTDRVPAERLLEFIATVEHDDRRERDTQAMEYFVAARSNSNDTGPRKVRSGTLISILRG
jgi:hypothetical protein